MINRTTFMSGRNILIISPSLNTKEKVSGVSSLIAGNNAKDYVEANLSMSSYISKLETLYSTL